MREALLEALPAADRHRVEFGDVDADDPTSSSAHDLTSSSAHDLTSAPSRTYAQGEGGGVEGDGDGGGSDGGAAGDVSRAVLAVVGELTGGGVGLDTPLMEAGIDSLTAGVLAVSFTLTLTLSQSLSLTLTRRGWRLASTHSRQECSR